MIGKIYRACLCAIALLAEGCSVNPVTGENELSLISTQQELAMGEQNHLPTQQSQGGQYTVDPPVQTYISWVGNKLVAVSDAPARIYMHNSCLRIESRC